MKLLTDSGADLTPGRFEALGVEVVPLNIILSGKNYRSGIDIQSKAFYTMLGETDDMPTTSQPAPGDFVEIFERIKREDPEILAVLVSSGLSGTYNAAQSAVEMVEGASIHLHDSRTLSAALGWQVEVAALAMQAGWPLEKITATLDKLGEAADSIFTLDEMKYLVHGGRVSHLRGLLAQTFNIKPIVGVNRETGKYEQRGRSRTLKKAIKSLVDIMLKRHEAGAHLHVQIVHGDNPEGITMLQKAIEEHFTVTFREPVAISPVLGAHTGPSLIGCAYVAQAVMDEIGLF